jgi:peptide/nickel transport system ATP-binding protein
MKNLKQELGTAMILITHDLGVVAETCDRVAVIYAGEVVETGTLEEIFTGGHHHPYTEGLFSSLPDLTKKTRRLNPIPGLVPDPSNLPEGCFFQPRCPKRLSACEKAHPGVHGAGSHQVLCHLFANPAEEIRK